MPHSSAAERALLGGLMLVPDRIPEVAAILHPQDFYAPDHGALFGLLVDRARRREPIDLVMIGEAIARSNQPDRYGGLGYVMELPDMIPSTVNLTHYAKEVRRASVMRRAIEEFGRLTERAYQGLDADALVEEAAKAIGGMRDRTGEPSLDMAEAVDIVLADKERQIKDGRPPGVPTGIRALDELLNPGLREGLAVLAARPSMGKTALALNLLTYIAMGGHAVGAFSMEMTVPQVVDRILSTVSSVPYHLVQDPRTWGQRDWDDIVEARDMLGNLTMKLDTRKRLSVDQIRAKALQWRLECGELGLIVVDYLGLMPTAPGRRVEDTGRNAEELKNLAGELRCPILLVHQLNRKVEDRKDQDPVMSDLKDSGDIEQHADAVLLLSRPSYHDRFAATREAYIKVAKNRFGPTGRVQVEWWGEVQRFRDVQANTGRPTGLTDSGQRLEAAANGEEA